MKGPGAAGGGHVGSAGQGRQGMVQAPVPRAGQGCALPCTRLCASENGRGREAEARHVVGRRRSMPGEAEDGGLGGRPGRAGGGM
jgi:hypothetical protein